MGFPIVAPVHCCTSCCRWCTCSCFCVWMRRRRRWRASRIDSRDSDDRLTVLWFMEDEVDMLMMMVVMMVVVMMVVVMIVVVVVMHQWSERERERGCSDAVQWDHRSSFMSIKPRNNKQHTITGKHTYPMPNATMISNHFFDSYVNVSVKTIRYPIFKWNVDRAVTSNVSFRAIEYRWYFYICPRYDRHHHIRGFASLPLIFWFLVRSSLFEFLIHFMSYHLAKYECIIYKSYKRLTVIRSLPSASALFYYYGSTASSFIYGHVFWSY